MMRKAIWFRVHILKRSDLAIIAEFLSALYVRIFAAATATGSNWPLLAACKFWIYEELSKQTTSLKNLLQAAICFRLGTISFRIHCFWDEWCFHCRNGQAPFCHSIEDISDPSVQFVLTSSFLRNCKAWSTCCYLHNKERKIQCLKVNFKCNGAKTYCVNKSRKLKPPVRSSCWGSDSSVPWSAAKGGLFWSTHPEQRNTHWAGGQPISTKLSVRYTALFVLRRRCELTTLPWYVPGAKETLARYPLKKIRWLLG